MFQLTKGLLQERVCCIYYWWSYMLFIQKPALITCNYIIVSLLDAPVHSFDVRVGRDTIQGVKVAGYDVGVWFFRQLQPPVTAAPLLSPSWKQCSMKPVILVSIARAGRLTTCMDVHLPRLPPHNFSYQKSDLARKIQRRCLQSLCAAATSSKCRSFFA